MADPVVSVIKAGLDDSGRPSMTVDGVPVSDEVMALLGAMGRDNMTRETGPALWLGEHLWSAITESDSEAPRFVELVQRANAPDELLAVPWESMVPADLGVSGVLSGNLIVTRRTEQYAPLARSSGELPLKMLVLEAPTDSGPATDWQDRLQAILDSGEADLMVLGGDPALTPSTLRRSLEGWQPDIVLSSIGGAGDVALGEPPWIDAFLYLPNAPRLCVLYERQRAARRYRQWSESYDRLSATGVAALAGAPYLEAAESQAFWACLLKELCSGRTVAGAFARASYNLLGCHHDSPWRPFALYTPERDLRLVRRDRPFSAMHRGSWSGTSRAPFLGLRAYGPEDREVFLGRAEDVSKIAILLRDQRRLLLVGDSGVGKSSVLGAGLIPGLREEDFDTVSISRFNPSSWLESFDETAVGGAADDLTVDAILAEVGLGDRSRSQRKVAVFVDQVEDLGQLRPASRRRLLAALLELAPLGGRNLLLLAVRSYSAAWLREELREAAPGQSPVGEMTLPALTLGQGETMLARLGQFRGFSLEPGLQSRLFRDLAGDAVDAEGHGAREAPLYLPAFSLQLQHLYRRRQRALSGDRLLDAEYPDGGIRELLKDRLHHLVADLPPLASAEAVGILVRMIDPATGRPLAVSLAELGQASQVDPVFIQDILSALAEAQFVRPAPGDRYELVHEILATTIRDEFMRDDIVESDQLRAELQAGAADFRETGEPLSELWIQRIGGRLAWSKLSTPELAFLFGSILLNEPRAMKSDLSQALMSLGTSVRVDMIRYLAEASHPKAIATAGALAQALSPIHRGLSPIQLPQVAGKEPSSRFLAESLVAILSRAALGVADEKKSPSEVAKRQRIALDLLERGFSSGERETDSPQLSDVLGEEWLPGWGMNLELWPGPWVGHLFILSTTFLAGGLLSRLLWGPGSQSLNEVVLVWGLVFAVLLGTVSFLVDTEIESLLRVSTSRQYAWPSRLQRLLRYGGMALIYPVSMYAVFQLLGTFALWVDEDIVSLRNWSRLTDFVSGLPGSLIDITKAAWLTVVGFLGSLPLLGTYVDLAMAALQGNWMAQIVIVAMGLMISWLYLMWAFLLIMLQFMVLMLALAPLTVLGVGSVSGCAAFLPSGRGRRRLWNISGLVACGGLAAVAAPWACGIAAFLIGVLQKNLWWSSWILDEAQLSVWAESLRQAAQAGFLWHVALWPPIAFGLLSAMSSRSFRQKLWRFKTWGEKRAGSQLRPLVAEGTYESLLLALNLVDRHESMRDAETFRLVWALATENHGTVLARPSSEEKETLADRAVEILNVFDDAFFVAKDLWKELGAPAGDLSRRARRRFRQLQMCVKSKTTSARLKASDEMAARQTPALGSASGPESTKSVHPLKLLGTGLLYLLVAVAGFVMCSTFFYVFRGVGGTLIDWLYPVAVPFGEGAWDVMLSVRYVLRFLQVVIFILSLYVLFAIPGLYRQLKSRVSGREGAGQHA